MSDCEGPVTVGKPGEKRTPHNVNIRNTRPELERLFLLLTAGGTWQITSFLSLGTLIYNIGITTATRVVCEDSMRTAIVKTPAVYRATGRAPLLGFTPLQDA